MLFRSRLTIQSLCILLPFLYKRYVNELLAQSLLDSYHLTSSFSPSVERYPRMSLRQQVFCSWILPHKPTRLLCSGCCVRILSQDHVKATALLTVKHLSNSAVNQFKVLSIVRQCCSSCNVAIAKLTELSHDCQLTCGLIWSWELWVIWGDTKTL